MTTAVPITRSPTLARDPATDVLRRFALLAALAFVVGFVGYLALGGNMIAPVANDQPSVAAAPAAEATASGPAAETPADSPAADDWNLPKKI